MIISLFDFETFVKFRDEMKKERKNCVNLLCKLIFQNFSSEAVFKRRFKRMIIGANNRDHRDLSVRVR